MAIAQNIGTAITAMLPALFVAVAPPGAANIPLIVGSITLAICAIAALAAYTAREPYRVQMKDLGSRRRGARAGAGVRAPAGTGHGRGTHDARPGLTTVVQKSATGR